MNPRTYLAIAAALRNVQPDRKPITSDSFEHEATVEMHMACCAAVADALARIDPQFDRERFIGDAGVDITMALDAIDQRARISVCHVFEDDLRGLER